MGGDGGDGSDGSDGSVGSDGGVSDNTGDTDSGSFSLSDFGGFGENASQADADAAAAAQTGLATGLDGVSATGFGAFGPTDAPTGNDPANTPGFGSFADASLGPGIGYGDIGGFGVTGFGNGISGFGGIGGFGSGAPGAPGGFGNIGVGTANDSIASTATGMGLGINDSTDANTTAAQIADLGNFNSAQLGIIGTPAQVAQAATPAQIAQVTSELGKAMTVDAPFDGRFGPTPATTNPAVDAINVAIAPVAPFTAPPSPPPTNAELGLPTSPPVNAPTVAEGLGTIAGNKADAALSQAQANLGLTDPNSHNSLDAALDATPAAVATIPGNFNIGLGNPSTAANVGIGASFGPGVSVAAAPAIGTPTGATGQASSGQSSVSAALANAIGSETGFGAVGNGLNFINPAGSILLAQYPWLGFQAATS